MASDFATVLAEVLNELSLNSVELAKRTGVSQQAISKWLKGRSLPSASTLTKLADLLSESQRMRIEDTFRIERPTIERTSPNLPLSLDELSATDFERFCFELFAFKLGDAAVVQRYGKSGHAQDGIDIVISYQHDPSITDSVQCKHVSRFGAMQLQRVVLDHKFQSRNKFILISRPATPAAIGELAKHKNSGWQLWDIDRIGWEVKQLPADKAEILLRHFVPNQLKSFLGITKFSPLLSWDAYVRPFKLPGYLATLELDFVGRQLEVEAILTSLESKASRAIVVSGNPGEGKTALIDQAITRFQRKTSDHIVQVLVRGEEIGADDLASFSRSDLTLVVGDAHDRDDIESICALFHRVCPKGTLLITTRSYKLGVVIGALRRAGLNEVREVRLEQLTTDELEKISSSVLARGLVPTDLAREIVGMAGHRPLETVILSTEVVRTRTFPALLPTNKSVQMRLADMYIEAHLSSEATRFGNSPQQFAELVALIQPVTVNPYFFELCEQLFGGKTAEYEHLIEHLKERGIVIQRGDRIRLSPDVLADYLALRACLSSGRIRIWIPKLISLLNGPYLSNLLTTAARLDFQADRSGELQEQVASRVIAQLIDMTQNGAISLAELLDGLEDAAYYIPQQTLRVLQSLDIDIETVSEKSPVVLRNIMYSGHCIYEAATLLWELAKRRTDDPHNKNEHPIAILKDLASPQANRLGIASEIADFAIELLKTDLADKRFTPFDFVSGVFAVDGHFTRFYDDKIVMRHYAIDVHSAGEIRAKALDAMFSAVARDNLTYAFKAVRIIGAALRQPMGTGGAIPSVASQKALSLEIVSTLNRLRTSIANASLDPTTHVAIAEAVYWHAACSTGSARGPAQAVLDELPRSISFRITLALVDPYGHIHFSPPDRDVMCDHEETAQRNLKLAQELLDRNSPAEIISMIDERMKAITLASGACEARVIVGLLCDLSEDFSRELTQYILEGSSGALAYELNQAVAKILSVDRDEGLALIKILRYKQNVVFERNIASALAYRNGAGNYSPAELLILKDFLQADDVRTATIAVQAIRTAAASDMQQARTLIPFCQISRFPAVADALFLHLRSEKLLREALSDDEIKQLLHRLISCPSLESHWVQEFVASAAQTHTEAVFEMLCGRIMHIPDDSSDDRYEPIPYFMHERHSLKLSKRIDVRPYLFKILDEIGKQPDVGWSTRWNFAKLAQLFVGDIDGTVVDMMRSHLELRGGAAAGAIAVVLNESDRLTALANVDEIEKLLREASTIDRNTKVRIEDALFNSAISGVRRGTYGQPFQEDIQLRDSTQEILKKMHPQSPAYTLYANLMKHATLEIKRERGPHGF